MQDNHGTCTISIFNHFSYECNIHVCLYLLSYSRVLYLFVYLICCEGSIVYSSKASPVQAWQDTRVHHRPLKMVEV